MNRVIALPQSQKYSDFSDKKLKRRDEIKKSSENVGK